MLLNCFLIINNYKFEIRFFISRLNIDLENSKTVGQNFLFFFKRLKMKFKQNLSKIKNYFVLKLIKTFV